MRRQAYMNGTPEQTDVVVKHLVHLLAYLRAMYLSYQTSHWQTKGPTYYGNHLLFQRLYESVQDEIDGLAEKIVGYVGPAGVNLDGQVGLIATIATEWAQVSDHHRRGLESEVGFQHHVKVAYEGIKAAGMMTLGLDDFLMATANAHEGNIYLLQQVLNESGGRIARSADDVPSAEHYFFDNPERREVREFAHSKAPSNVPAIAQSSGTEMGLTKSETREDVARAKIAPPTPTDIREKPGAKEFSTLNRYLVETKQPTDAGVPKGYAEVRKHSRIDPSNDDIILSDGKVVDPSHDDYFADGRTASLRSWTFASRGR